MAQRNVQMVVPYSILGAVGSALVFTAAPAAAATSATLVNPWPLASASNFNFYFVITATGALEAVHIGTLTQGSTAVTWVTGLSANCNAQAQATVAGAAYSVNVQITGRAYTLLPGNSIIVPFGDAVDMENFGVVRCGYAAGTTANRPSSQDGVGDIHDTPFGMGDCYYDTTLGVMVVPDTTGIWHRLDTGAVV